MRNVADRGFRENQNTFQFNNPFFIENHTVYENMEKCGVRQATDDNMVHAHCMLGN